MKQVWTIGGMVLIALTACVPLRDYREKTRELDALNARAVDLRKEMREIQKENRIVADTIRNRSSQARLMAKKLSKSLESYRFRLSANPMELGRLSIRGPEIEESQYEYLMKKYFSRDTFSARNISWLSKSEKDIYYYLNWARLNPRDFCNRFVIPLLKRDSTDVYVLTLIDYMYRMKPMNALVPEKEQYESAKCHAESSGKLGYVGHQRQTKDCVKKFSGECCSYGLSDPLSVVLQLLVDRGVSSLGHRYICLGWYSVCGISMAKHSGYGYNVVLDFG